ncbi:glucosamine-6-phosphate deaminase [Cyanobium sp. Morenito 9A2]|nr:glucosamine-6-phosphate deaminase [Cyanobium sp. Morenito 9A2]
MLVEQDAGAVADRVAERLIQALTAADRRPLGLATGRTMEPVYAALRRRLDDLDPVVRRRLLEGWSSFNLDDYIGLAPDHPASFQAAMGRNLGEPLGLSPAQLRLPDGTAADPEAEARRYADALAAAGGLGLQLLGLGENGHVGFNEPPCGPGAITRCVRLSAATRRQNAGAFGGDPERVPERAITVGLAEILAARSLMLVVTGASKASILRRVLEGPPREALPASWLLDHPHLLVIADRAAMGQGG